jgi:hypothetical protein
MLRLTPSIHLSLGLPLLRVPSVSQSKTFSGSLFPACRYSLRKIVIVPPTSQNTKEYCTQNYYKISLILLFEM